MLWQHYVLRRGPEVQDLWDRLFESRQVRLLYIAGRGFDVRAQAVMRAFIEGISSSDYVVEKADLVLLGFTGYQLSDELKEETEQPKEQQVAFLPGWRVGLALSPPLRRFEIQDSQASAAGATRIGWDQ